MPAGLADGAWPVGCDFGSTFEVRMEGSEAMSYRRATALVPCVIALSACAQTAGTPADEPSFDPAVNLPPRAAAPDASFAGASASCGAEDWRCADLISPGGAVVWVDQDLTDDELDGDYVADASLIPGKLNRVRYGVRLRPYFFGRFEVTNAAYQTCVRSGACLPVLLPRGTNREVPADYETAPRYREHPALVNWFQARMVCLFLGGDIPTKAQWQYAARGPEGRSFPWGEDPRCALRLARERGVKRRRSHPRGRSRSARSQSTKSFVGSKPTTVSASRTKFDSALTSYT